MSDLGDDFRRLIAGIVSGTVRYKCVVLTSADLRHLDDAADAVQRELSGSGVECKTLSASEFLDDIGALSQARCLQMIEEASAEGPVLLEGPLVFLDYWAMEPMLGFWRRMAALAVGRGVFVFDSERVGGGVPDFELRDLTAQRDVKTYRSRLDVAEGY